VFPTDPQAETEFEVVSLDDFKAAEDVFAKNKPAVLVKGTAKSQCNGTGITHKP